MTQALLLVDVQNDFSPSGALPVADGDQIVPVINRLIPHFKTHKWQPKTGIQPDSSFASSNQQNVGGSDRVGWNTANHVARSLCSGQRRRRVYFWPQCRGNYKGHLQRTNPKLIVT